MKKSRRKNERDLKIAFVAVVGLLVAAALVRGALLAVWPDQGRPLWVITAALLAVPILGVASGVASLRLWRSFGRGETYARRKRYRARR